MGHNGPGSPRLSSSCPSRGCDGKWDLCALGPQFLSVKWDVDPLSARDNLCARRMLMVPQGWRPPDGGCCRGGRGETPAPGLGSADRMELENGQSPAKTSGSLEVPPGSFFPPTHLVPVGIVPSHLEASHLHTRGMCLSCLVMGRGAAGGARPSDGQDLPAGSRPLCPTCPPGLGSPFLLRDPFPELWSST